MGRPVDDFGAPGGGGMGFPVGERGGSDGAGAGGSPAAGVVAGFLGYSGWTSGWRPSRSGWRRTRWAWAASRRDEWLLTPSPSALQRSSVSLLESPSSRANS